MPKPPTPHRRLGDVVRTRRATLGWSQDELAHRCGLNRVYMGEVERGEKSVSIDTIIKIAAALKVKGGELLLEADI